MKELIKKIKFFLIISIFSLTTGCQQEVADNMGGVCVSAGTKNVTFLVNSNAPDSRTIVADSLDYSDLRYFLVYSTDSFNSVKILEVEYTSSSVDSGIITLELPATFYNFKLYAVKKNYVPLTFTETEIKNSAVLLGTASADLTHIATVHFFLSSNRLTGTAPLKIKLYSTNDWDFSDYSDYECRVGLFNHLTGQIEGTAYMYPVTNLKKYENRDPSDVYDYTVAYLTAGTYNFEVQFRDKKTNVVYTYSDRVFVSQNQEIDTVVQVPFVIGRKPDAPVKFVADYQIPESDNTGYFNVEFRWDCPADNENGFKIQILTVIDITSQSSFRGISTEWTGDYLSTTGLNSYENIDSKIYSNYAKKTVTPEVIQFYDQDQNFWVSGSLEANSTQAIFKLPLEKRYLARICSYNEDGDSEWTYVTFDATPQKAITSGYKEFPASANSINLFRVQYYLEGGTLTDVTGAGVAGTAGGVLNNVVSRYYSQGLSGNVLDIINPLDTTKYTLIRNGMDFVNWKKDKLFDGTIFTDTSYAGFKNLTLFALFSDSEIYNDVYEINLSQISLFGTGVTSDGTGDYYTLDKSIGNVITFKFAPGYGLTYDLIKVNVKRQGRYSSENVNLTVSSDLYLGTYELPVETAEYIITFIAVKNNIQYEYPVFLKVN